MPAKNTRFPQKSREAVFWNWFVANKGKLARITTGFEPIVASLTTELTSYHPGLTWECSVNMEPKEFIISANGIRALFPVAQRLIAAAPQLPNWKFIALRPAKGLGSVVLPSGKTLHPDEVWFDSVSNGPGVDILVAAKGLTPHNIDDYQDSVFLMLDSLLGEEVVETRIYAIDYMALPDLPALQGLKPISKLPELLGLSPEEVPGRS